MNYSFDHCLNCLFGCLLQESSESIGEVFQDESNMAAILMRRQLENGDLLMVSRIKFHSTRIIVFVWSLMDEVDILTKK